MKTCCCSGRASAAPRALEASLLADDTFDRLRPIAQRAGAHHAPPPLPVPPRSSKFLRLFFGEPPPLPLPLPSSLEAELTAPGDSDRSSLTTLGAGCPPPPSAVTARGEEAWGLVGVAGEAAGPPPGREGATSSKTLRRAGSCRMSSALRSGAPSLRACEVFSLALRSGT